MNQSKAKILSHGIVNQWTTNMTYLSKKEAAIVSNVERDSIDIYMPHAAEDEAMPRCMVYMAACALRYNIDPKFVEDMLTWMDTAVVKANGGMQ